MPNSIIVDIYCRNAIEPQEATNTLEEQEQICREYCAAQGLTVSTVYHEVALGGDIKARPMLDRLRSRYREGTIQSVVVTRLDRLANSDLHLVLLVNEMEAHQVRLYIVEEELADSLQGRWVLALSAFLTVTEREKTFEL
jgi:site-specific DNA recombinase